MHTSGGFILHGGDNAFANRQKLLFDKLSDAELECNKNKMVIDATEADVKSGESNKSETLRTGQKRKNETKRFRGKESIFKRPEGVAPRAINKGIPDYRRNPHKWMRYSLDDVSNDDMTEQSNTKTALSFLKELRMRRSMQQVQETEKMSVDDPISLEQNQTQVTFKSKKIKTSSDIQFKKPEDNAVKTESVSVIVEPDDKPTFRSSKIIMPEYIVGQKQKKKNKKEIVAVKVDRMKEMKLQHLEEPDEEEN